MGVDADGVNGLPGPTDVADRLDALLARGQRPAVYLVSVDGYDTLVSEDPEGARAAMREAARRLDRLVRSSDVLGAVAPGTFVLVGAGVTPDAAGALVERIEGAAALPVEVGGQPVSLKVDIGLAFAASGSSADELLGRASADLDRVRRRS